MLGMEAGRQRVTSFKELIHRPLPGCGPGNYKRGNGFQSHRHTCVFKSLSCLSADINSRNSHVGGCDWCPNEEFRNTYKARGVRQ